MNTNINFTSTNNKDENNNQQSQLVSDNFMIVFL